MKTYINKYICVILIVSFVLISCFPSLAYYADASKVEITVTPDNNTMLVNGENFRIEKPRYRNGELFVPLKSVMEAFGAEFIWKNGKTAEIVFRNIMADLEAGKTGYTLNQGNKKLKQPPFLSNGVFMAPVSFITENFGILKASGNKGAIKLVLPDDGALSDLSFLTGGISKSYVGNSYFNWSLFVPKGSRVANLSFNSASVTIDNEQRNMGIDVYASQRDDETLEDYYNRLTENPELYFEGELLDSRLNTSSKAPSAEFYYTNSYDEAVYTKAFFNDKFVLSLSITAYNEADPKKITSDKTMKAVIDSFKPVYPTAAKDIQDFSKVKYGLARYENYISSDNGKKYFTWEMSVLPEWNLLSGGNNPFYTELGVGDDEYVSIEMLNPVVDNDAAGYYKETRDYYSKNFNRKYYTLTGEKAGNVAGLKSNNLEFTLMFGDSKYSYQEWFVNISGLLYDITFKCPSDRYDTEKQNFAKMLDTLKLYQKDEEKVKADMEKYSFNQSKTRVGKDDSPTLYENKQFTWSMMLPGYWNRVNENESKLEVFTNKFSGAAVSVEAAENTDTAKDAPYDEVFGYLSGLTSQETVKEISTAQITLNGKPCTQLVYRLEDEENKRFADISVYVVTDEKYSYCIISSVQDVCASDSNLKELSDILSTFTVTKAVK